MKKYLLGLLAIVMAVAFSSFTSGKKIQDSSTADYYWYVVDVDGFVQGTTLNPGGEIDKTTANSMYASECEDDDNQPFCILGSHDPDLTLGDLDQITDQDEDATILKTE